MSSYFAEARRSYHSELLGSGVLCLTARAIPSNADGSSAASVAIASAILRKLQDETSQGNRLAGQISGSQFEQITKSFVEHTFLKLGGLRPGNWDFTPQKRAIARFEQYRHLAELEQIADAQPEIAAILGRDYVIAPDLVVVRNPEPDTSINALETLVDESVALRSGLRKANGGLPLLHASISCKWTLRSDRAQNARSEALNLIRNRKGRLPHVVVVTGEPLPSRLASIALGTGDIDCVYHFALHELIESVEELNMGDTENLVRIMTEGRRLKDISDLPLDLAV